MCAHGSDQKVCVCVLMAVIRRVVCVCACAHRSDQKVGGMCVCVCTHGSDQKVCVCVWAHGSDQKVRVCARVCEEEGGGWGSCSV